MESQILRADEHSNGMVNLGSNGQRKEKYPEFILPKFPETWRGDLALADGNSVNRSWTQYADICSKSAADDMEFPECRNGSEDLAGNRSPAGSSRSDALANLPKDTVKSRIVSSEPQGSGSAPVLKDELLSHSYAASKSELFALEKQCLLTPSSSCPQGASSPVPTGKILGPHLIEKMAIIFCDVNPDKVPLVTACSGLVLLEFWAKESINEGGWKHIST